jgi:hypothetical protein
LIEEFFENAIDRLRRHYLFAKWAFVFTLAQPLINAYLAEHMVATRTFLRIVNQLGANVALEIVWTFSFAVDSLANNFS